MIYFKLQTDIYNTIKAKRQQSAQEEETKAEHRDESRAQRRKQSE